MNKQQSIDELLKKLLALVPNDLKLVKEDFENNMRAQLDSLFRDMHLVSRQEYDIQTKLLKKTRALVEELSEKVAELEREKQVKS